MDSTWVKTQKTVQIEKLSLCFFNEWNQLKASSLFPRMTCNFSCFIFVSRVPVEAKTPEIKECNDIISVTDDTEREFIDIDVDLLGIETFTQEEMNTYPSNHEG